MDGEKIGGYETKLTPRAERERRNRVAYEEGWNEGERELRPENVRVVEHILSTIRMDELRGVFLEYLQKSGVPAENANVAAIEKIFTSPLKSDTAMYIAFVNQITLSTRDEEFVRVRQFISEDKSLPEELLLKMQLILVHEMCHAFARVRLSSKDANNATNIVKNESGYQITESRLRLPGRPEKRGRFAKKSIVSFMAFNEGVTQRIAEEIFLEYGKKIRKSEQIQRFLVSFIEKTAEDFWRYPIYCNQIDMMCERIGEYTGVPKEAVWQSFKRGYFEQPQLFHEDTIELFKQTFGEAFLEEYSAFGNDTPIDALGKFDGRYNFPHPEGYAEKWLRHLGIFRDKEPQKT